VADALPQPKTTRATAAASKSLRTPARTPPPIVR
jgi:hypothetical protein